MTIITDYMKNVNKKKETSELFPTVRQPFPLDERTISLSAFFEGGVGQGA